MTELPKIFYHGSTTPLKAGDFLRPRETFNSDLNQKVSAVFATPDFNYAKKFAISSLLSGNGLTWFDNNKMIFQKIKKNVLPKFFVFEIDGGGFQLDARNEYYFNGKKEIWAVHEFDSLREIENMKLDIYEFDELQTAVDWSSQKPRQQKIIDDIVENKKLRKVDIRKIINN